MVQLVTRQWGATAAGHHAHHTRISRSQHRIY
jgi:hypothetical protein